MSGRHGSASEPQRRTDTLVGAGMRVAGNVTCTGVLRVQGDILGNVACREDGGALVVDATGSVTGAVEAARIVVRGRIIGPLHAAQSIDIQPGGNVVGDAFYREIVIHAGGLIDGVLTPALPADGMREERPGQALPAGVTARQPPSMANTGDAGGAGRTRRIGGRVALGVLAMAVAAGVWLGRSPPTPAPPAADAAAKQAAPPPASPAADRATPPPPALADAPTPVQPASPAPPAAGAEEVIVVQGVNPAKPAGVFLLVSREPTVLYRKKREETGEGRRHVVPQGRAVSVAIGRNEVFRVAEGRNLEIFFQGRKVAPKAIENGAWLHFVPHGAGGAGEGQPGEAAGGAAP